MNQQKVWNKIALEWNKFRIKPLKEVQEFLKNKKGNILDLGCGTGRNFIKINGLIYGIDFSSEMIKFAKINAEKKDIKVETSISSLENLPFENNFFNSTIFIATLHCIETKEKRKKTLKELFRVLKPNSECLITVWSKKHPKLMKHPKDATVSWKTKTEELHRYYYLYDKKELEELLKKVGFEIISIKEDNKNIIAIVKKPKN
jgi:ubiquinone/menaquinone biosynthesis C-methylase UbiE|tara:strand:- start:35 stop:643 length:609 start_codon:yes stop_codon:yes gene_type:complete